MTPDEHYREAERLLASVTETVLWAEEKGGLPAELVDRINKGLTRAIAQAQVHATLATIYRSTERLVEK